MEDQCEVALPAAEETRASGKRGSRLTLGLLACTLCLAACGLILSRHNEEARRDKDDFDLHHTLREVSDVRAAIHLEGQYNPDMTSVEWKNHVDQSHSQGGLELNNNEILIPQKGLYFVYSQASFRIRCSVASTDDNVSRPMIHLSHTVKRWSSSYGNIDSQKSYHSILHSVRTACQRSASSGPTEEGSWYSAVYMGAVFSLDRGDRLKTETLEKTLPDLEDEPGKTFFGVFAL
ncbi:tumor necrosis factor a (TNF superfamily, member 2) [Aulostomus maculatus]